MSFFVRRPWDDRPEEFAQVKPSIDASLVWAGSSPRTEIVRGVNCSNSGTVSFIASPRGRALSLSAGANSLQVSANANLVFPDNTQCTIAILRRHKDTTNRASTPFGYVSGGDRVQMNAPWSDGNCYWDFGNATDSGGGGRVTVGWGTKSTNYEAAVFVAGGGKGREVWRAGVRLGGAGDRTASRALNSSAVTVGFNGTNCDEEEFALVVVSKHAWSDAEVIAWSRDPYGETFDSRRIFVPVAAAGGALNIDLDSGSYAYTGHDATFAVTRVINLDAGSYSYTGQTATLSYGRALSLDAGSYTYTGQTADFTIARKIDLDAGSYAYTGQDATLSYTPSGSTYNIDLDAGAYTYTGQAVDFTIARNLALDAGVYTYTGQDAGLVYSGASSVTIKAGSWLRYRVI